MPDRISPAHGRLFSTCGDLLVVQTNFEGCREATQDSQRFLAVPLLIRTRLERESGPAKPESQGDACGGNRAAGVHVYILISCGAATESFSLASTKCL